MKVKIDEVIIPDAKLRRFIHFESGLPLSMIMISCEGRPFKELMKAFQERKLVPFESDVLKTKVLLHGFKWSSEENKVEYTLQERAMDVPSGYKLVDYGEGLVFVLPENTIDIAPPPKELEKLPFIRLVLRRHIPEYLFKKES